MSRIFAVALSLTILLLASCKKEEAESGEPETYEDQPFWQEYHEPYIIGTNPADNEVRSILADQSGNIWVATAGGFFTKSDAARSWTKVDLEEDGPAYAIAGGSGGTIWLGNWNGVYKFQNGKTVKVTGTSGPISALLAEGNILFAMGPGGLWLDQGTGFQKQSGNLPRSVRDLISDEKGGIWIASDVGLYHWLAGKVSHYYNTDELISGYTRGLAFDADRKLWVGGLGGVTIRSGERKEKQLTPENGLPSVFVTALRRAADSTMWVGTKTGVVRYRRDGSHSLRFSRRWLLDDEVTDISFGKNGTAWIATPKGVSAIRKRKLTLASKSDFFQTELLKRHVRAPWIVGQAHLRVPGDTATWEPEDDDNDGEYGGNYLAMESFRFAVTKDPQAKANAKKSFEFLKFLQDVTGTEGFFARTIIPAEWTHMHDENRTFTEIEKADELVKEPRFKPVEVRWRKSKDGKWLWKGDTSSDEMCGHMFGYYFYYTLAADNEEKKVVAAHVSRIVDHLIKNNFNLIDIDGTHTRWSVWSPDNLNRDPEWMPDRNQNSMEILAFLKLAHFMTGNEKYQQAYLHLIEKEHYLDNMSQVTSQNPAWFIYFDVVMQAYLYPIFLHCEKDPERLKFYQNHLENWFEKRKGDRNPLINFIYSYSTGEKAQIKNSVDFLIDTPLDLVDWPIDHSKREDVAFVRKPTLEEQQLTELQPASIRLTVRWDKNPWTVAGGNPEVEREPVFWLLPYWMGRYLNMISE